MTLTIFQCLLKVFVVTSTRVAQKVNSTCFFSANIKDRKVKLYKCATILKSFAFVYRIAQLLDSTDSTAVMNC